MEEKYINIFQNNDLCSWYRAKHKYEQYEIFAIDCHKNRYKDSYFKCITVYFKKENSKNIANFLIKLEGTYSVEFIKMIEADENFIILKRHNVENYCKFFLNKNLISAVKWKIKPIYNLNKECLLLENSHLYFYMEEKLINEYLPLFKNLILSKELLKNKIPLIDDAIKQRKTRIKYLEKEIKEEKEIIKKLEIRNKNFENIYNKVKDIIGEDEFASQSLIYEFTKGSFK